MRVWFYAALNVLHIDQVFFFLLQSISPVPWKRKVIDLLFVRFCVSKSRNEILKFFRSSIFEWPGTRNEPSCSEGL